MCRPLVVILTESWCTLYSQDTVNFHPSFRNYYLCFGLVSETCLGVFLAYCPGFDAALRMYGLRYVMCACTVNC